jgi:creatinine amidohydrolase
MRFTDFTYDELAALTPRVPAFLVPMGCTEQQGPHMNVDFDALMITRLCEDIAASLEKVKVTTLVMPTLPFGPTPAHAGFKHGYINLRQSTHEAIVEDILNSLAEQGFGRLLVWRGCGQHELGALITRFNAVQTSARAYQPTIDYGEISRTVLGELPGGHADSFATSVCMFLDSARVRSERIRLPENSPIDWSGPVDFATASDTGVIGDPTRASREAGERLWELCVEQGTQIVLDILAGVPVRELAFRGG